MSNPLAIFRKYQKVLLAVFGVALMIVFTVGGLFSQFFDRHAGNVGGDDPVVSYRGGTINESEMQNLRNQRTLLVNYLQQVGALTIQRTQQQPPAPLLQVVPAVNDERSLLQYKLLGDEAKKMGMSVEKEDAIQFLRTYSNDSVGGKEFQDLLTNLTNNRVSPNQLFAALGEHILAHRFIVLMAQGFDDATPLAQWEYFKRLRHVVEIEAVAFPVADFISQVAEPTEREINALYEEGKNRYGAPHLPEPGFRRQKKVAIAYIKADLDALVEKEKVNISDEDVQTYYEENKEEFRSEDLPTFDTDDFTDEPTTDEPTTDETSTDEATEKDNKATEDDNDVANDENDSKESDEVSADASNDSSPVDEDDANAADTKESVDLDTNAATSDTDEADSDNADSDNADSDNADSDNADSDNADSDNADSDDADSDDADSDNADSDNADSDDADDGETETTEPNNRCGPQEDETAAEEATGDSEKSDESAEVSENNQGDSEESASTAPSEESTTADTNEPNEENSDGSESEVSVAESTDAKTPAQPDTNDNDSDSNAEATTGVEDSTDIENSASDADLDDLTGEKNANKPTYKTLEEAADEIRTKLARKKLEDPFDANVDSAYGEMKAYFGAFITWEQTPEEERGELPSPPDLEKIAAKYGFTAGSVPLVDFRELQEVDEESEEPKYEIGIVSDFRIGPNMQFGDPNSTIRVVDIIYNDGTKRYDAQKLGGQFFGPKFLFWKTDETPDNVPTLEECRDEVIAAIKKQKALAIGKQKVESEIERLKAVTSLKDSFGEENVVDSGSFSWLTSGLVTRGQPKLSTIPGILAGNDFMESVFALDPGQLGSAIDQPNDNVYLVLMKKEVASLEGLKDIFIKTGVTQEMQYVRSVYTGQSFSKWYQDFEETREVQWLRETQNNSLGR